MTPPTATRRALLATGAVLAAGTSTAQALTFRDLLPTLRLGANLERWFPVAAAQRPRRLGPGWWQDLRAAGFDHARLFIPRDAGAAEAVPRLFLQAIEGAATARLPLMLPCPPPVAEG